MPAKAWKRCTIKEGAKGPIAADLAFVRAVSKRGRRSGHAVWVIFRRSISDPTEIKYFLSNAPARISKTDLVHQAGFRRPIETALEEGKSELGMDHYETRTWRELEARRKALVNALRQGPQELRRISQEVNAARPRLIPMLERAWETFKVAEARRKAL